MNCPICGGEMIGDGFTEASHCERTDILLSGIAPDEGPIYCDDERYVLFDEDGNEK